MGDENRVEVGMEREANVVYPEDFGAAGDGVTDCTAAIQAAVNEARAKGTHVVLADGATYAVKGTIDLRAS